MGDLRQNLARLAELSAFILSREGSIPYFYCDRNGWVTIGIGTLVKTENDARQMARNNSVHFSPRDIPHRRAGADDVVADWRRVHDRPGLRTRDYLNIAQLRLDSASVNYLLTQEISRSATALYHAHPFLLSFDARVAMAFVDTRYNRLG